MEHSGPPLPLFVAILTPPLRRSRWHSLFRGGTNHGEGGMRGSSPQDPLSAMASNCTGGTAAASAGSAIGAALSASKTKTKKKHFVCQKVKLFRASEPLLSVLMWGVNHTINELSNVPVPVMLMPDDFKAYSKIKVDNHLFNK
ncbi:phosphatidylinositol 5-phosphate 4-kinase type-2 beta-like [Crotalus tigris]|uniref:phosphatidylinositol 5-phosphate 4-kinase type-2 beta-like n=1 Tax=Crotalus tigris TaxID=88082 RepID=UPI00192F334C|nr:phosphatidylinositol 5-phosphate 4-kinase type-2 beta-like [Crotalus tigris]